MLKMTVVVFLSGFAVVFAEDVADVQTTDVVSRENIYFCGCMGDYAKILFKLLGLPCAMNTIALSTKPHEMSEEMRSVEVYG